jgi:hypothetical protein
MTTTSAVVSAGATPIGMGVVHTTPEELIHRLELEPKSGAGDAVAALREKRTMGPSSAGRAGGT